jgi:EpsI family protein
MKYRYTITLMLLTATELLYLASAVEPVPLVRPLTSIPNDWQGFQGIPNLPAADDLAILKPSAFLYRTYQAGDSSLNLFLAYFEQQDVGTIAHSPQACLPFGAWNIVETRSMRIGNGAYPVTRLSLAGNNRRLLAYYWHQNSQRVVASELESKFFLAWDRLFRHTTAGSFVRVVVEDTAAGQDLAVSFSEWVLPQVAACLRSPR